MNLEFIESKDYLRKRKKFCDKVERTLLRLCNQGLPIKQFKFGVNNFQDLSKDVDLWLKLICETGVEGIELYQPVVGYIRKEVQEECYILLASFFEAKSLTKLVLIGRIGVHLTFMKHLVKVFSLQVFSLEGVSLGNEQQMKHLIIVVH